VAVGIPLLVDEGEALVAEHRGVRDQRQVGDLDVAPADAGLGVGQAVGEPVRRGRVVVEAEDAAAPTELVRQLGVLGVRALDELEHRVAVERLAREVGPGGEVGGRILDEAEVGAGQP
jgi:hypothetical protein